MAAGEKSKYRAKIAIIIAVVIVIFLVLYGRSAGWYTSKFYYVGTTQIPAPPDYIEKQHAEAGTLPNLVPVGVSVEKNGTNYLYTAGVQNMGGTTAGQFTMALSSVDPATKFSTSVGTCTIWFLNSGVIDYCNVESSVEPKLIQLIADSTNTVKETSETDNTGLF